MRTLLAASLCLVASVTLAQRPKSGRDPFENQTKTGIVERGLCDSTLCRLGVDNVRLVAVVGSTASPVAMFEDRSGIGYLARKGTRLGPNARVSDIAAGCVVVTSFVTAESGRQEPVKRSVCLERTESEVLDLSTDAPVPVK
jgi:hypothetical protein